MRNGVKNKSHLDSASDNVIWKKKAATFSFLLLFVVLV